MIRLSRSDTPYLATVRQSLSPCSALADNLSKMEASRNHLGSQILPSLDLFRLPSLQFARLTRFHRPFMW